MGETLNKMRRNINAKEAKKIEADGGLDLNEVETIFATVGLKPLPPRIIEKFYELDTNENGKIEESEFESEGSEEGEDYSLVEEGEKCSGVRSNGKFEIDDAYCYSKYYIKTEA